MPFRLSLGEDCPAQITYENLLISFETETNSRKIAKLIVRGEANLDIPSYKYLEESFDYMDLIGPLIGDTINDFCIRLPKDIESRNYHIYNGDNFTVGYAIQLYRPDGSTIGALLSGSNLVLTADYIQKVISEDIKSDFIDQLFESSRVFLERRNFDQAIFAAYSATEVFSEQYFSVDKFCDQWIMKAFIKIKSEGNRIDKYFNYGPYFYQRRTLQNEFPGIYHSLRKLKDYRDYVAHQGSSLKHKDLIGLSSKELYDLIDNLVDDAEDAIQWLKNLDCPIQIGDVVEVKKHMSSAIMGKAVVHDIKKVNDNWLFYLISESKDASFWVERNSFEPTGERVENDWSEM